MIIHGWEDVKIEDAEQSDPEVDVLVAQIEQILQKRWLAKYALDIQLGDKLRITSGHYKGQEGVLDFIPSGVSIDEPEPVLRTGKYTLITLGKFNNVEKT